MSKNAYVESDDDPGADLPRDAPEGQPINNAYASRTGDREPVPVLKDENPVEDPVDAHMADSDQQLRRDDEEAIDKGNIMKKRTRRARPGTGTYREPPTDDLDDEE